MKRLLCLSLLSFATLVAALPGRAAVRLPAIFGDHMVLQRDQAVPVWGWADPGEKVSVSFAGQTVNATAGADGRWSLKLAALKASSAGATFTVAGKNKVEFSDVLVGEVWLCSGQSNMEWAVSQSKNAKDEIAAAKHPRIRHIKIPHVTAATPQDDVKTSGWQVCTPESVPGWTAVGYYFAREIQKDQDVPVGLIGSNWGGTRIEPWTAPVGFQQVPALANIATNLANLPPKTPQVVAQTQPALDADGKAILDKAGKPTTKPVLGKDGKQIMRPVLDKDGNPTFTVSSSAPLAMYNAMIHPLVPFAIRGALWYQGESNNGEGMLYYEKMKALIQGWRAVWKQGDFPFGFVQLAPYNYGAPRAEHLAGIWESQTASLAIPNTGMAVITDIATVGNIHPPDKQEVGRRLALWALTKTYGKKGIVYSGPLYDSLAVAGGKATLKFTYAEDGLAAKDGKPLTWFSIAGADKKFYPATAEIQGGTVVVSSPQVAAPVAVRFGWNQLAEPNLANKSGLPASPFRTDKWTDATMVPATP